ncbi:class III lanthionine synthetase LanKC [Streptomyces sp. NPDC056909]|uniref:class III lanthionine synthetase LanKC n=1 Tax=Streptomyces sp. NPDC056909 TaxID=3345963 RepID=UPI0036C882F7
MLAQGHLAADPFFADSIDRIDDAASRFDLSDHPVPAGWRKAESGGWVYLHRDGTDLPPQGWKIHVSATAAGAALVVDTVWAYCVERGVCFKFLRSAQMLELINSKQSARSASGKLVTIYPAAGTTEDVLRDLEPLLAGVEGPYVLSDLRWGDGPLYLRYGGFSMKYCFAPDGEYVPAVARPDGTLVPDVRGTAFRVPPWVEVPDFVEAALRRSRQQAASGFPYRVEKALHFSNSGGVYRAVEKDTGRAVVLREGRPHAGVDAHGVDAVARLAHEAMIMRRLAGLDVVPALFDEVRHWEHRFLVEELVDGEQLLSAIGRRHPLLHRSGTAGEAELAAYTRWALGVLDRIENAIAELHGRGVVFGDLQPSNIMVRPDDTVCLVDFETSFAIGEDFTPAFGTAGFIAPWARRGVAIDAYGLACVRLAVFCPLTPLLRFDADKAEELTNWVEERFPVPPEFGRQLREALAPPPGGEHHATPAGWPGRTAFFPGTGTGSGSGSDSAADWSSVLDTLRDTIVSTATPDRADRLFPGDIRQFEHQGAGLAYGAAGVLHALHATGRGDYDGFSTHVDWLVRANEAVRLPRPGLYDGLGGVAVVLDGLGRGQAAREALGRLDSVDLHGCGPGLFGGLAGIALAHLHLGDLDRAARLARAIVRMTEDPGDPAARSASAEPGLMWGWSGPALLFVRLFSSTGDRGYLRHARTALARDIARCGVTPARMVHVRNGDERITAPARGSAGIGLVLHEYLRHEPDAHFAHLLAGIRGSLGIELMLSPGLFDGHAGLLYAMTRLGGTRADQDLQLRALGRHAVGYEGRPAFALEGLLRLSMDLATGTAGVLIAVHTYATADATPPGTAPLPLLGVRL